MGVLGENFKVPSFLPTDAVGSGLRTALREYINGDTPESGFGNSSGKPR